MLKLGIHYGRNMLSCLLACKLGFGLSFKNRIRILYRNYSHHTVTGIGTCVVIILFLKKSKLSCIAVYELGKLGLEACDMCSALLGENVVTEAVNILLKIIRKLDTALKGCSLRLTLEVNLGSNLFLLFIYILDKGNDSFRLMELLNNRNFISVIPIMDGKLRVKVCSLMKS